MRCLFGPIGGAVQQDVLAAADVGEESEDASGDDDFASGEEESGRKGECRGIKEVGRTRLRGTAKL